MIYEINDAPQRAFLSTFCVPSLTFSPTETLPTALQPIWEAHQTGNPHAAQSQARHALDVQRLFTTEERAALTIGLAAAELTLRAGDRAKRLAGQALELFPMQWSGHRILLSNLAANQSYQAAYLHLEALDLKGPFPAWDEPMDTFTRALCLAAWAWQLSEWEAVASHLNTAYPHGIHTMPTPLLQDWFKLSLYRERPEDAATVADLLIAEGPVEQTDELLQAIVLNGWTKQALPLYRKAYAKTPQSQLLRRRLVALCIREGALDEARLLAAPGALTLAA